MTVQQSPPDGRESPAAQDSDAARPGGLSEWDAAPTEPGWYWLCWATAPHLGAQILWLRDQDAVERASRAGRGCRWHGPMTPPALPEGER